MPSSCAALNSRTASTRPVLGHGMIYFPTGFSAGQLLAVRTGGAVAVSGAVDQVTDGARVTQVPYGHPLMTKVTGVGCALGALVAACCAVESSPLAAATAATAMLTVAADSGQFTT